MQKRMKIMLIAVGIVFGGLFLYKVIVKAIIKKSMMHQSKVITVSAMTVDRSMWQPKLSASGSLRATQGVDVTTELAGMVQAIYLKPGSNVKKDELLIQLNADNEVAQLHALEANAELAKITYLRDKAQYAIHAVSKQTLDNEAASLKNLIAQAAQQTAIVAKKTIRAPFAGRLGINNVNLGQFINPGNKIVTLQALDPIFVDFYIPQQQLSQIKEGQSVIVTSDTFRHQLFRGKITTIDPAIDVNTRNVRVEATVNNSEDKLIPGMFASIEIITGKPLPFLTVPQTAISFNPYGDLVYIVRKSVKKQHEEPMLTVMQRFVTTGETRGEQIQVLKGLKSGDVVVTNGQLKLKNGSQIVINNTLAPPDNPNPILKNNH